MTNTGAWNTFLTPPRGNVKVSVIGEAAHEANSAEIVLEGDTVQVEVIITRRNGPPVSDTLTGNYKQMAARMRRLFWRQVIAEAFFEALGNRQQAAKLLGISYRSLFYAMKACGFPTRPPGNPNQQRDPATGQFL